MTSGQKWAVFLGAALLALAVLFPYGDWTVKTGSGLFDSRSESGYMALWNVGDIGPAHWPVVAGEVVVIVVLAGAWYLLAGKPKAG